MARLLDLTRHETETIVANVCVYTVHMSKCSLGL